MSIKSILCVIISLTLSSSSWAITYELSWIGSNSYAMSGEFSFSDTLVSTRFIDETEIDSLNIEVFQGAASLGTWDMMIDELTGGAALNFNFDALTETFVVGGNSQFEAGQQWNAGNLGTGVGFISGSGEQSVYLNGIRFGIIDVSQSTLTATHLTAVPIPATAWLFGSGLLGLIAVARKKVRV